MGIGSMNIQTPAARRTDPETSHFAAQRITQSGSRMTDADKVLAFLVNEDYKATAPMTGAEIAARLDAIYYGEHWTREKALKRLGDLKGIKVKHGPRRACEILEHGPLCVTWELI